MPNPQPMRRREEVIFAPNQPVTVALKYAQGKTVSGQSGERIMYTTTDDRVMFLDLEVASRIEQLGVNVREDFTITMQWDGKRDSPRAWRVERLAGEKPDGTFVVPGVPPADAAAARKPMGRAALVEEAVSLVDTYMEVLEDARKKHGAAVDPDAVKALVITTYIQRRQLSSVA